MSVPYFSRLRTIVEEPEVSAERDKARADYARFDEAWDGLTWLLARKADSLGIAPNIGDGGLRLYVQDGDEIADTPQIWVMFRVTADAVQILTVNFRAPQSDDDI